MIDGLFWNNLLYFVFTSQLFGCGGTLLWGKTKSKFGFLSSRQKELKKIPQICLVLFIFSLSSAFDVHSNFVLHNVIESRIHSCYFRKCKLYRFDKEGNQWKERGVGTVKLLKHKETQKIRLVMRQSKTLKICANHLGMLFFLLVNGCGFLIFFQCRVGNHWMSLLS